MYKALRFEGVGDVEDKLNELLFLVPEVKTFKVTEAEIGVGIRNIVIYPKEKSGLEIGRASCRERV